MQSVEAKKPGDTLRDVEAEAFAETLADRQEELKAGKVGETLTDLKAASPVVTLAPTLAEMKAQTVGKKNTERSGAPGIGRNASCRSNHLLLLQTH